MNAKFKEGEEVMAVHDIPKYDIHQGDIFVVEVPITPCCGGVMMQGKPNHFEPNEFESMNRPVVPIGGVNKEECIKGINRLFHLPMMAANQGFIPVEAYRKEIFHFLDRIGLAEAFKDKHA